MTVPQPGPPRPPDGRLPRDPAAEVAHAMAGLDDLAARSLAEHVEAFERVHAALVEALAAGAPGAG